MARLVTPDPSTDTSPLSFVRRAMADADRGVYADAAHAARVADAAFDTACADTAALAGVARPARVVARYIVEWA